MTSLLLAAHFERLNLLNLLVSALGFVLLSGVGWEDLGTSQIHSDPTGPGRVIEVGVFQQVHHLPEHIENVFREWEGLGDTRIDDCQRITARVTST